MGSADTRCRVLPPYSDLLEYPSAALGFFSIRNQEEFQAGSVRAENKRDVAELRLYYKHVDFLKVWC